MTFSIVARSPDAESWGVAVATKYLAVGAMVPAAEYGAGALATQAETNMGYREAGLSLLRAGLGAAEVMAALLDGDDRPETRQVGVVDREGVAATWTGPECEPVAGGRSGTGYAIQGNLLASADVIDAMEQAWLAREASRSLAKRLLDALAAGDAAGGDRRGRQSAALYVVGARSRIGYGTGVVADLRVDDALQPVGELARLLELRCDLEDAS